MGLPQTVQRYTPEQYYALERDAKYRSEYYQGEIFAMAGGSRRHSRICSNLGRETGNRLLNSPCTDYDSNLRLHVLATGLRDYPDLSVYCGKMDEAPGDSQGTTFTNPTALFEVLSQSTEAFDRGLKWRSYQQIASLKAYILVSQDQAQIDVFDRQADGSWAPRRIQGMDCVLAMLSLKIQIPLAEIYNRVDFTATTDEN